MQPASEIGGAVGFKVLMGSKHCGMPAVAAAAEQLPGPGAAARARPEAARSGPAAARLLHGPPPGSVRLPGLPVTDGDGVADSVHPSPLPAPDLPPPGSVWLPGLPLTGDD